MGNYNSASGPQDSYRTKEVTVDTLDSRATHSVDDPQKHIQAEHVETAIFPSLHEEGFNMQYFSIASSLVDEEQMGLWYVVFDVLQSQSITCLQSSWCVDGTYICEYHTNAAGMRSEAYALS